jgi:hypothetical protein
MVAPTAAASRPATTPTYEFFAGAGSADTTPPLAGTAAGRAADAKFAPQFTSCPASLYPDSGRFALQEPFDDVNGTGLYDPGVNLTGGPDGKKPDPYCDANDNNNWDGIYQDNGFGPATGVNDPLDARAFAISDGHDTPVVYVSVDVIGLFDYYTGQARADLLNTYHVHADMVVSADHNESSPDTLGLYGALQTPLGVGVRSGIDEYYMDFLDDRIAQAAAQAVHNLQPASLYANQIEGKIPAGQSGSDYPLLGKMTQRISDQFPTSVALPGDDRVAAVDTKMGILQARNVHGTPIFTVINLAAHNQEMGNSGAQLSADWPGAMEHYYDAHSAGLAIYLVGDNGSEEDPETNPVVIPNGSENHTSTAEQYKQSVATGQEFAQIAAGAAKSAVKLEPGAVTLDRIQFCVPLENNGFVALAAAGEFGKRQAYVCNSSNQPVTPVPNSEIATTGAEFRTFAGVADIGPEMQMLDIPGEAFPALILGSPFSQDTESCPRPNPSVPMWHAHGLFRFSVGLADDEIGYLIPAWGFASGTPGLFNNDTCYQDEHGHGHKLESESVGPTSANDVANNLTALLEQQGTDPTAHIVLGRYVLPNGSFSSWPTGAVGVLIAPAGSTTKLDPGGGTLLGDPSVKAFGRRTVDARGVFMDYDGQPQAGPDVTTRGIMLLGPNGCVTARYYVNVFPDLSSPSNLGSAVSAARELPTRMCPTLMSGNTPELQPGAAAAAGLPATAPFVCARPSGGLTGRSLGPVTLGMTRAHVRSLFARLSTRGRQYMDFFCGHVGGIRVGYPSPQLLRTLPRAERRDLPGRAILILTASSHYALRGVRPGSRLAAVTRRLRVGSGFQVGLNRWYLTPDGPSRGVLKVRHGVIEEIGIANRQLTDSQRADRHFLSSFS